MKFQKLNTQAQQREAIAQGRSPSPYRLRYKFAHLLCEGNSSAFAKIEVQKYSVLRRQSYQ
ncbi:MAG: hypothetical protein LBJ00_12795 [Planctomycetaceae bacterium]|nr:hypothetical protein [Planctomycetaceae bacterium]